MSYIWSGIIVFSFTASLLCGRSAELTQGVMDGAGGALNVFATVLAMMCLWGGISKIAERSGITHQLSRLLYPLLRLLFPDLDRDSEPIGYISMNMTANLLGMGNAATPLGLRAMSALHRESDGREYATRDMIMLVVMNTASIQIIPTTVAALRSSYGSASPMDILVQVWIASAASFTAGAVCVRLMDARFHRRRLRRE